MGEKVLLTLPEVADRLGVGRTFAYGLIQRGELTSIKLGRARRVAVHELEAFVKRLAEEQAVEGAGVR